MMSPMPVMNWIGFLRVMFLPLNRPQLQVQLMNSALGRVFPYHSEPAREELVRFHHLNYIMHRINLTRLFDYSIILV